MAVDREEENRALRAQVAALTQQLESERQSAAEQQRQMNEALAALEQRREEERELYEELMSMQDSLLAELSTPLIPVAERVLVLPLIGSIDSARGQRILEVVLKGVAESRALVILVDISGINRFHPILARLLVQVAQAVRLLGSELVVSGVGATAARSFIEQGLDLEGLKTCGELRVGIEYAFRKRREGAIRSSLR